MAKLRLQAQSPLSSIQPDGLTSILKDEKVFVGPQVEAGQCRPMNWDGHKSTGEINLPETEQVTSRGQLSVTKAINLSTASPKVDYVCGILFLGLPNCYIACHFLFLH